MSYIRKSLLALFCVILFSSTQTWDSAPLASSSNALYVSTTGSDSNPGTSSAPFRTIVRASQAATPGTTVYVQPGTYFGDVYVTAPGVTYKSTVKWGAILVPATSSSSLTAFWNDHAANVTIDGFLVNGNGGANNGAWADGIYCDATNCTIKNNKVVNIATQPPGSTYGNGGAGIYIDGWGGNTGGLALNNIVGNVGVTNPSTCETELAG